MVCITSSSSTYAGRFYFVFYHVPSPKVRGQLRRALNGVLATDKKSIPIKLVDSLVADFEIRSVVCIEVSFGDATSSGLVPAESDSVDDP